MSNFFCHWSFVGWANGPTSSLGRATLGTNLRHFLLLTLLCLTMPSFAQDLYPFKEKKTRNQFQLMTHTIRCVVCQNQTLADSNAPLAVDLRRKIYEMLNKQKSPTEIEDYLVERYGQFILFNPPLNKATLFLWSFPFLAIAGIVIYILLRLKREATKQTHDGIH